VYCERVGVGGRGGEKRFSILFLCTGASSRPSAKWGNLVVAMEAKERTGLIHQELVELGAHLVSRRIQSLFGVAAFGRQSSR
jgi:hypothetical protein